MTAWFSRKSGLDSLTADRLLEWMGNALAECIGEEVRKREEGENTARQLALITLYMAGQTARNLLSDIPSIANKMSQVYLESKLYYDCLWQRHLLNRFGGQDDRVKIGNLYSWVGLSMQNLQKSVIQSEPTISSILNSSMASGYDEKIPEAIRIYVHGVAAIHEDATTNGVVQLALRINDISGDKIDKDVFSNLAAIIMQDTIEFSSIKLLTQFDLSKCEVLVLPDSFYR